jgi:DNA-binding IclR family transcriptional regulator
MGSAISESATVKSSLRTLEILEYFSETQAPARLTDIARKLDYPPSSALAILRSLTATGYVDYDARRKTFVPTIKFALIGSWINDRMMADGTILRMMHNLQRDMETVVVLGAQSGLSIQYILVKKPKIYAGPSIASGSTRPLLASAMGQAILSAAPPETIPGLVRRINASEPDPARWVKPGDFLETLERTRQQGFAYSEGAASPGRGMVAVLLATPPHQPPLALGLGGSITRLRAQKAIFVRALKTVVEQHREQMELAWDE